MTETEFLILIDQVLKKIEKKTDEWYIEYGIDIDINRNGYVLYLFFQNGLKIVINSQSTIRELWLATQHNGFHYHYDGENWKNTRGGLDFFEMLSKICSKATGIVLTIH